MKIEKSHILVIIGFISERKTLKFIKINNINDNH